MWYIFGKTQTLQRIDLFFVEIRCTMVKLQISRKYRWWKKWSIDMIRSVGRWYLLICNDCRCNYRGDHAALYGISKMCRIARASNSSSALFAGAKLLETCWSIHDCAIKPSRHNKDDCCASCIAATHRVWWMNYIFARHIGHIGHINYPFSFPWLAGITIYIFSARSFLLDRHHFSL